MDASNKPLVFQRLLWAESIFAIKESLKFNNFSDFRNHLEENLHQNSSYVRERYTRSIIRWFFPERSVSTIATMVWKYYNDDKILCDIMRYQYLCAEPIVAEFVTKYILPLDIGKSVNIDYFRNFLSNKYGSIKKDPLNFLGAAVRDLGYVYKKKKDIVIQNVPLPKTAFLILIHYIFAPQIQTVTINNILNNSFWKYLGIRDGQEVKKILKEADSLKLISKYIISDQLEQITTKYSLEDFIQNKLKL